MKQIRNYLNLIVIMLCHNVQYSFTRTSIDYIYLDNNNSYLDYLDNNQICFPKNDQLCRSKVEFQGTTYYIPPFHEAMINHPIDEPFYLQVRQENKLLQYLKRIYDEYLLHDIKFSKKIRIPKIIHQIWIGPNKPPEHFEKWKESWLKLHPTWEYILWDEEKIAQLKLVNKEFIDQENNYGAKSDLIRYEIIYQFGGVYVDIDFECLKPLDFLHHCCDFYGSFFEVKRWSMPTWVKDGNTLMDVIYQNAPRVVNGIFAAKKHHPLVEELIRQASSFRERKHILTRVGPDYFKTIVFSILPLVEGKNIILPSNYFFSWGNKCLNIMPETLGVHHYTGTWGGAFVQNKKFNSVYTLLRNS